MFDDRAAAERALEALKLCEPPERDVEGALQLVTVCIENHICKNTSLGRLVDVAWIFGVEDCDHRTSGLVDDR